MTPFPALVRLVINRLRWIFATGDARDAEILALRHQLLVLQRQINRPHFTDTDRTILGLLGSAIRSQFIRSQSQAIIATDFACFDTALLKRFHVLFVIEHATSRVHLAGITANPTGQWTTQTIRNFCMRLTDSHRFRFMIRDGAGQFTR